MSAESLLRSLPLFRGLPPEEVDLLGRMMHSFSVPVGRELFSAGDVGEQLLIVEEGELAIVISTPEGTENELNRLGPGSVLGEMSLLGPGTRTATARATRHTTGWALERSAFDFLRADLRAGSQLLVRRIGQLALERLAERYSQVSEAMGASLEPATLGAMAQVPPVPSELAYLRDTLFFSQCDESLIAALVAGLRRLTAPRGTVLFGPGEAVPDLFVVVRGAVETVVEGGGAVQRLRLAGPGRAVGHLGALGHGPSAVSARARERVVLIEWPWGRVTGLLEGRGRDARAFQTAFYADVVRSVPPAERPSIPMGIGTREGAPAEAV